MSGYEINFSITALCSCCGNALPSNSYLTESKSTGHPLDRDNPYARKDRRVFITPCEACFEPKKKKDPVLTQQKVYDEFSFLEGVVGEETYTRIVDTACALITRREK